MREILFRGKTSEDEWVYRSLNIILDGRVEIGTKCTKAPDSDPMWQKCLITYEISPETVGQYTGLTDKNGTKIFEGDVLKFGRNIYQISFEEGSFILLDRQGKMISKIGGVNNHCYSLFDLSLECCWEDDWAIDIEVIGNIYDNPELLKGGADNA